MKKILSGVAIVLIMQAAGYAAQVASQISAIEVAGNNMIASDKILASVESHVGDTLSQEKAHNDVKAIYSLGYFEKVDVDLSKAKNGTKITFIVKENPVVKEIRIIGNTIYSTAELSATMQAKVGQILNYKTMQEDVAAIDDKYHKDGYMLEKVVDVSNDPQNGILTIRLVEGMIESVALEGNDVTKDYVILRELNSVAGTVMNEKTLQKDLRRIFNLGFFSDVSPDFSPTVSPDRVILLLKVKETRTNTVNFGGGYGEREGMFGFLDLSADNLVGSGQGLMVRGQAGVTQSTYQFRYIYPWLLPDKLGKRVTTTFKRWLTSGKNVYLISTDELEGLYNGWDITFSKPINDEWSSSVSLGSERANPIGIASFEPYTSNTVGLTLSYDTRDNWMNPSMGRYYVFGIRRGLKLTDRGESNFTTNTVDLNTYLKVAERQTVAMHVGVGIGMGDVPTGEVYYVGGVNTVRGYYPTETQIGKRKILANIEYRYTFNETFQGVVFFDWGEAYNTTWPDVFSNISGKGFGIRLNTPMGPIRLDYGIGANRSFSEGVLHFSIGQAF